MGLGAWLTSWLRPAAPVRAAIQPAVFVDAAVYKDWREANRRPLWLPQTQAGQFPDQLNRFGGAPDLAPDETWPRCRHCGATMPLFLQLDVASLPAEAPMRKEVGQGLVQLFGCTDCGVPQSEDGSAVARLLAPAVRQTALLSHETNLLPPRSIVGWRRHEQLPTADEWEGDELPDEEEEPQLPWVDHHGFGRDQLGGWPTWVQGAEYPPCPVCQQPQRLLFQIASEQGLDFIFCDVGTAYLLYCSHHPDQLSFSWQST